MGSGAGGQRPLEGYRQYDKEKTTEEEPIDKEEFKKIMEVESATEAPKKKKRQDAEVAEELEGLVTPQHAIHTPTDKDPSPLEITTPQSLKKETYSGQKHEEMLFVPESQEEEMAPPEELTQTPIPTSESPQTKMTPQQPEEQQATQPEQPAARPIEPQQQEQTEQQQQPQTQQQQTEEQTQTQQPTTAKTPTSEIKKKVPSTKKPPAAKVVTTKAITPTEEKSKASKPDKKAQGETPKQTMPQAPQPQKKTEETGKKSAPKTTPQEESAPITHKPAEEVVPLQKEKQKKAEEVAESGGVLPADTPAGLPQAMPAEATAPGSYVNLSPAVFELFDKMVSYITIEHSKAGGTTALVQIDMKGSVFNGAQLKLTRLPSSPNTFNIDLEGTPDAVNLYNANMTDLAAAFQGGKYQFEVNLRPATLLPDYRGKARRVTRKEDTEKNM